MEKFNSIYEYKVSFKCIESNTYFINKIAEKKRENSLSLLWNLEGELIELNSKRKMNIVISRISASSISFCFKEDDIELDINKAFLVKIEFDDKTELGISGRPVKGIEFNNIIHYEFIFVNLRENEQSKIYRQLFMKQLSLRKLLN